MIVNYTLDYSMILNRVYLNEFMNVLVIVALILDKRYSILILNYNFKSWSIHQLVASEKLFVYKISEKMKIYAMFFFEFT